METTGSLVGYFTESPSFLVGIGANASMWVLGPQDQNCSIRNPSTGKRIFPIIEDPAEDNIEPNFNQIWFTVFLVCSADSLALLRLALRIQVARRRSDALLVRQWIHARQCRGSRRRQH